MTIGPGIAEIGGLIGDPVRAAMLAALIDGRALPAGELAFIGNVTPQTASFHLGKLLTAGLISVEQQGRHKYYRIATETVASALEVMAAIAPVRHVAVARSQSLHQSERAKQLRYARSCYSHLAGRLAVDIYQAMVARELLAESSGRDVRLTEEGERWWQELGILVSQEQSRRTPSGVSCLDWTERQHHLGGQLGVALFRALKEHKWLIHNPENRYVRLTHAGECGLESVLGLRTLRRAV